MPNCAFCVQDLPMIPTALPRKAKCTRANPCFEIKSDIEQKKAGFFIQLKKMDNLRTAAKCKVFSALFRQKSAVL